MTLPCPADSNLRLLLDENVDDSIRRDIEVHLETCSRCQKKIESWLDISNVADATIGSGRPDPNIDDDTVERLMQKLQSQPPIQPPSQHSSESKLSGQVLGGYRILEPIGYGSTGVVYRAEDPRLARQVAVKVLRPDFASSDRARSRLEREARAAASLGQQNVVSVFDVCIDPIGISYLVMELVEGGTLRDRLRDSGAVPPRDAAQIVHQLLAGLAAAHEKGLVHRDIKSSNILIESKNGLAKLTDFGLVRDLESDSNLTRDNAIAGTPAYMSPEQVLSPADVDSQADIYSLAVVLYEMLSGELPFRGVERMVLKQVIHDEPRSLRRQNDSISRDLETICFKAMAKVPEARYESAKTMSDDIERWLEGKPILARPVGTFAKLWNWSRRNAGLAALLAISTLLLVLLAVGSTISALSLRTASLETKRHAVAATRQRDQSLETLRTLIFDVNELLEPGEVDLDEAQVTLLTVALKGIEEIERTGADAGVVDVSSVAAKNRLGDVYYRLDRFAEAEVEYQKAVDLSSQLSEGTRRSNVDQKTLLQELLRSYEGLASIAMFSEEGNEGVIEALIEQAEKMAETLTELTGEPVEPMYFADDEFYLSDEEVEALAKELEVILKDHPKLAGRVESATEMTQSLGWHYLENGQDTEAERTYRKLLRWVGKQNAPTHIDDHQPESGEAANVEPKLKPRFERAISMARFAVYNGLSGVASMNDESDLYVKYLRQAVDCLPTVGSQDSVRFHRSASDIAETSVAELLNALDELEPEPWMATYYGFEAAMFKQKHEEFPTNRKLEIEYYLTQANYVQVLAQLESSEADSQWSKLKTRLEKLDFESLPNKYKRRLSTILSSLEQFGFLHSQ